MKKFIINETVTATVSGVAYNGTVKKIWHGFTHSVSELTVTLAESDEYFLFIGDAPAPTIGNSEYAYICRQEGISLVGRDRGAFMRGLFDLLMQVEYEQDGTLFIRECDGRSRFIFEKRMIHICAFAETRFSELRKLVRLAAAVGYTHAVLEFWGMFPYECERGLSWREAYGKDELRALASEMRELGIEPIPMINHLGHAANARVTGGKHSALDTTPALYRYFTPDGWAWDVSSPYTRELLAKMRAEQYEIFGGEFFHLGLDEAYMYATSKKHREMLPEYLTYITDLVVKEGRRPMIWMDMFLPPESGTKHLCVCEGDEDMYKALSALNEETVLVDWEYNFKTAPFPTADYINKKAPKFDIMCAPWTDYDNFSAAIETVNSLSLFGFMMTTWHTMAKRMYTVLESARLLGAPKAPWSDFSGSVEGKREECATLLRKLSFEGPSSYRDAGWCDGEISLNIGDIQ